MGYNLHMDEDRQGEAIEESLESVQPDLSSRMHAFLFAEGGSLTMRRLSHLCGVSPEDLSSALDELSAKLEGTALALVRTDTEVSLVVGPQVSGVLRESYEKDLGREVGDAGLEVLAILMYRGASTRAQIDYIRGVNTSSTVRTLLSRGLVERTGNPNDGREYVYRPTVELLAHLGITRSEELPEYAKITAELAEFEAKREPFVEDHGEPDDSATDAD
jgi:segregation and condensation protein B